MEFLVVFVPLAVLVDIAWIVLYFCDRRLVRIVRGRYPGVFEAVRGRARRWYDPSEEVWVQQKAIRRRLRGLVDPLVAGDAELAAAIRAMDAGERWLRRAAWTGGFFTALVIVALVVAYRETAA